MIGASDMPSNPALVIELDDVSVGLYEQIARHHQMEQAGVTKHPKPAHMTTQQLHLVALQLERTHPHLTIEALPGVGLAVTHR